MLIIVDQKIPEEAKNNLRNYGEVICLETENIVYEGISGHPDIFFTQINGQFVVSPNLPQKYLDVFNQNQLRYILGEEGVGDAYPQTSKYNAVVDDYYMIHNFRNTDSLIIKIGDNYDLIHVDQGYTRCNLLSLGNKHYITSDRGIVKTLKRYNLEVLYVNPADIFLPGFKHGFIGGCAGIHKKQIFFIGSLKHFHEGDKVESFVQKQDLEIIELYDGPLFDGGSLIFVEKV